MAIEYRKWPVRYAELWFDEPVDSVDVDVVLCRQRSAPLEAARCQPFCTRVIDLTADEQDIFGGFPKETRRHIRKAETRDHLVCDLWMPGQWNQNVLDSFRDFHNAFARSKNLPRIQDRYLSAWGESACVALSRVKSEEVDLVWVSHIVLSDIARVLYGGSLYRDQASDMKQMMARGNKFLQWSLIRAFKGLGCKVYDLGGWYKGTEDVEKLRLNAFKKEFGGQIVTQFDCVKALTLKGQIYLGLNGFRHGIRQ